MYPLLLHSIPLYFVMWACAAIVGICVGSRCAVNAGFPARRSAVAIAMLAISVLCGSKLLYLAETFWFPFDDYLPLELRNSLHGLWADYRSGNADIYFTLSQDHGSTWLPPKAIAAQTTDEFFPTVTIDDNHIQRVVYYRRTSQSSNTFNSFFMSSANGTGSFTGATQVNDGGNISPVQFSGTFIGDYIGIDGHQALQPAWMDSRLGQQDIYTSTVTGC